ncbi:hypothetical protein JHK85_001266 [Glycine max]|nr:hypothetical protein JHK85_001266 [Glycine max]
MEIPFKINVRANAEGSPRILRGLKEIQDKGNDAVTRHCRHKHELDDHPTQAPKGFCLTNYVRRMLSLRDMTSKDRICYLLLVCLLANSSCSAVKSVGVARGVAGANP